MAENIPMSEGYPFGRQDVEALVKALGTQLGVRDVTLSNADMRSIEKLFRILEDALQDNTKALKDDIEAKKQESKNGSSINTSRILMDLNSNIRYLSNKNSYISRQLTKIGKRDDKDRKELEELEKELNSAINSLQNKIETEENLTDEQIEQLQKEIETLNEQKKVLKDWSSKGPVGKEWIKISKEFKDKFSKDNIANSIGKAVEKGINLFGDAIINRFVQSQIDGFNKVYDSIEKTRNEISARLGMNQGAYESLQLEIMSQIEASGYKGAISQSDVNEAIISLVSSGITDPQMLRTLAFEQAKLSASGSVVSLGDERILKGITQIVAQEVSGGKSMEDALKELPNLTNAIIGTQDTLRESGNLLGISNNQFTTMFANEMDTYVASGKGLAGLTEAITQSMYSSQKTFEAGLSADFLSNAFQKIASGDISGADTFTKILLQSGINAETAKQMSRAEFDQMAMDILSKVVLGGSGTMWTAEYERAYQTGLTKQQYDMLAQFVESQGALQVGITAQEMQKIEDNSLKRDKGLKESVYLSQTEKVKKDAENDQAKRALWFEKFYEGDKIAQDLQKEQLNVVNGIKDYVATIAGTMTTAVIQSLFGKGSGGGIGGLGGGSGLGGSGGEILNSSGGVSAKGLLQQDINAGGVAKGVSVAAGAVQTTIGAVNAFDSNRDALSNIETLLTDPTTMGGVGAIVGGALGGPIGAAIGDVGLGLSATLGQLVNSNETAQTIAATIGAITLPFMTPIMAYTGISNEGNNERMKEYASQISELEKAGIELQKSAQEQMASAEQQKQSIKDYSDEQKKEYLIKHDLYTNDQEINAKWEEIIKGLDDTLNKSKAQAQKGQIVESTAQAFANITDQLKSKEYKKASDQDKQNQILGLLSGSGNLGGLIDYLSASGTDVNTFLKSDIGLSDSDVSAISPIISQIMERKKTYDVENAKFQKRWSEAKSKAGGGSVLVAYYDKYGINPELETGENDEYLLDSNGLPYLYTAQGKFVRNHGEGKTFKNGLSLVPYDGFSATLHKGERVLTASEADIYNDFVANELTNSIGANNSVSSSNVFTTAMYGLSEVSNSIDSQTNSLTDVLNKILNSIIELKMSISTSGGISNSFRQVLNMNTNVTQLNTM